MTAVLPLGGTVAAPEAGAVRRPGLPPMPAWRRLPWFVLRLAGFPLAWVAELADGTSARSAGAVLDARARADRAVEAARRFDAGACGAGRDDHRVLKAVRAGRRPGEQQARRACPPVQAMAGELVDALDAVEDAERRLAAAYDAECASTATAVADRFRAEPALQDVLLVSNEGSYDNLVGWLGGVAGRNPDGRSPDRKQLDTLVRYLQRVCAKNDTTSHFGPLLPGLFDPDATGPTWRPAPMDRRPLLSRWAAEEIAALAVRHPDAAARLRPRRAPGAFLDGRSLRVVEVHAEQRHRPDVRDAVTVRRTVDLDDADLALVAQCTGEPTTEEIASRTRRAVADVLVALRRLEALGAVVGGPDLPYGVEDPLAAARSLVPDAPAGGSWGLLLDRCAADVAGFAAGGTPARQGALSRLKHRFRAATRVSAERGGGFYGDRTVLNEQCLWAADDLRLPAAAVDDLAADLGTVYDLFLLRPRHRLLAERELLAAWFEHRFPGRSEVGMGDYLAAFLDDVDLLEPGYRRVDAEVAEVGDAVERALFPGDGTAVHRVDRAAVEDVVRAYGAPLPAVCNPDLMLLADSHDDLAAGRVRAVVGEVHATEENLSHGSFAPFVEERFPGFRDAVVAAYDDLVEDDEEIADVTQHHRNRTWVRSVLPCHEVEAMGRSPRARSSVSPLHDLSVCRTERGLRLRAPTRQRYLRLMVAPLAWQGTARNPFAGFSFPWSLGAPAVEARGRAAVARIEVGRVVVQRATWRVPAGRLADGDRRQAFVASQSVRRELGLPRHLFARVPGEAKPVYCDLDSPLLVRQLTRMAAAATGDVVLSEMLPGPGELWLHDRAGAVTSEIRYAAFAARTPAT